MRAEAALLLVLGFGATIPVRGGPITITDDFNNNLLNPSTWSVFIFGDVTVAETNQRLEIQVLTAGSLGLAAITGLVGGNFDARVDFALVNWPTAGVIEASIGFLDPPDKDATRNLGSYLAGFGVHGSVSTSDTAGRLRLTRVGSAFSAYYWGGTDWMLIQTTDGLSTADAPLVIGLVGDTATGAVAFDNFSLTADRVSTIPEPSSWTLIGVGLALLTSAAKRLVTRL